MGAWIQFRGVKSSEMSLFVEQLPARPRAKKRMTDDKVVGRSGTLHTDTGAWEDVTLQCTLNLANQGRSGVYEWLSGSGDLIFSDDPTKAYHAQAIEQIEDKRRRSAGRDFDTLTCKFTCEPFRYEASPAQVTVTGGSGTIQPQGTVDADPWIFVTGSGDVTLTVGGRTVELSGLTANQTVLIDCDAKMCVLVNSTDTQVAITLADGEWPVMSASAATAIAVTGTVSSLVIQPNWRWI